MVLFVLNCTEEQATTILGRSRMTNAVYTSRITIRRLGGPLRSAALPAEPEPVLFGVHGAIAEHYGLAMEGIDAHAATLDYVVAAAGG